MGWRGPPNGWSRKVGHRTKRSGLRTIQACILSRIALSILFLFCFITDKSRVILFVLKILSKWTSSSFHGFACHLEANYCTNQLASWLSGKLYIYIFLNRLVKGLPCSAMDRVSCNAHWRNFNILYRIF